MYRDSSRAWITHNGGEIIFDHQPLVPRTWNSFCYKCSSDGKWQIWVNGENVESDKYQHKMDNFVLKAPILLGTNFVNGYGEQHRFFGEISELNIWTEGDDFKNIVDGNSFKIKPDNVAWNSEIIKFEGFEDHISIVKEKNINVKNAAKVWVLRNIKSYESGFQDCEKLGGNPLFTYDMNNLKVWDKNDLCGYFWMPAVYREGKWWERNSNTEIDKV